jgi:conjugative transfer pilus assembly protein TraH
MKRICIYLITIFYSLYSLTCVASVQNDLAKVWESLGGESVANGANFYKGQKAGHYTMGSMYFARQKKNRPLISVNPPEIDIDKSCYNQGVLNFGGMSFISGSEIKDKLTSISQQAGLMFAYLGISSISPVIGETLQEVYSKLQELGGFLADECQTAKQIVSFAGNKLSQHSEIAKDIFSKHNLSQGKQSDLSNSYKKFPNGKKEALSDLGSKDERYIIEDINLAWKAIDKLKIDSKEIKELMMTMSGTVIIKAAGNDNAADISICISSDS